MGWRAVTAAVIVAVCAGRDTATAKSKQDNVTNRSEEDCMLATPLEETAGSEKLIIVDHCIQIFPQECRVSSSSSTVLNG
jgi:hypothetical protein